MSLFRSQQALKIPQPKLLREQNQYPRRTSLSGKRLKQESDCDSKQSAECHAKLGRLTEEVHW